MAIPLGDDSYGHAAEFNPAHTKANAELDLSSIRHLKVQYIYIDPQDQTVQRREALGALLQNRLISVVYNSNGRVIYELAGANSQ